MSVAKILCVEHHPEYLDALEYMLEGAGYDVVPARSGAQALVLFANLNVQGVLLEYDLPDITGGTLRSEMKRIKPEVPILLFSGVGSQTPFLLRFFDSYLRNAEDPERAFHDLER
jgi:DNA-binding response OmpR family regulator